MLLHSSISKTDTLQMIDMTSKKDTSVTLWTFRKRGTPKLSNKKSFWDNSGIDVGLPNSTFYILSLLWS